MKKTLSLWAAVLAVVAVFTLSAAGGPPRGKGPFGDMDTNKDGKISKEEWIAFHTKMFQKMDKNGDGFLSEDEMRPPRPEDRDEDRDKE